MPVLRLLLRCVVVPGIALVGGRRGVVGVVVVVLLCVMGVVEVAGGRRRAGAAARGGVGPCAGAAGFRGAVGLVCDVEVVDGGDAVEAVVAVAVGNGLPRLEALAAGVGAGVGLDVLEAVGHALGVC